MFDLMMAVLERNAAAEDVPTRNNALDLMEKRMRFTRLYPGKDGEQYASVQLTGRISKIAAAKNGLLKSYQEKEE